MSKKKGEKKMPYLEGNFQDILVCKKKELRPHIEIFVTTPENFAQQNLGTLAGIFEITDESEDSSYIVNYLISIIKKEYFSKPKRGALESFEAALHKANLALSKLAEHENVAWINNFNAVCIAIEKNNLHLSQSGLAGAYLLRSKALTNICDSGEEQIDSNPLKTFEDVLSGRLEQQDKIILTTDSIFDIFSIEEIKRSALKFTCEEFVQFLKTALINELERAAVLVVDMQEKDEEEERASEFVQKRKAKINAFSQQTFVPKNKPEVYMDNEERQEIVAEIKKELIKTQEGFVDKRTGHIYIKDDGAKPKSDSSSQYLESLKIHVAEFGKKSRKALATIKSCLKDKLLNLKKPRPIEANLFPAEDKINPENNTTSLLPANREITKPSPLKNTLSSLADKIFSALSTVIFYSKSFIINRLLKPLAILGGLVFEWAKKTPKIISATWVKKSKNADQIREVPLNTQSSSIDTNPSQNYINNPAMLAATRTEKLEWFQALSEKKPTQSQTITEPKPETITHKILPDFSKLKLIFSRLEYHKKIYLLTAIILLFAVPYFFNKIQDKIKERQAPETTVAMEKVVPLANDINVKNVTNIQEIYTGNNVSDIINVNGKMFAVSQSDVISLVDQKNYSLPQEFTETQISFEMNDLNLLFGYKEGKITSFSANARKFQANNINVPTDAEIADAKSFLTYAYFLDIKNNQIYRFPRAEGGFGEKINWLKESVDFSNIKSMAINDSVYLTDGKAIIKYFRGKKQDFNMENTATPVIIDSIYTNSDITNLYILDKTNARVIKLAADGKISAQYYNSEIKNTTSFAISEENNMVYISDGTRIKSFSLE